MLQCAICYDDISDKSKCVKTPCGHSFHNECLTHWLIKKDNCPICRFQFGENVVEESDEEFEDDEPYVIDIFSNLVNCNLSNKDLSYNVNNTIHYIIDDINNDVEENNRENDFWIEEGNVKFTEVEIKTKQQSVNIYIEYINELNLVTIEMLNKPFNPINKKIRNNNIKTQNWRFKKHNQRQYSRKTKKHRF